MSEPLNQSVRDLLADEASLAQSRAMSMSERLEYALAWNKLAADLREGVATATRGETPR